MDKDKLKGAVASELIIVAMETKGKRPTQLNFEEMIDVVADVVNKISAYPMLAVRASPLLEAHKLNNNKMSNDTEQRKEDFETIYFDEIGMCGCGQPEDVRKFIYELLKNHKEYKDEKITYEVMAENRKRIIKETDTDVVFEFVFHILEHNDLLEHGSSVYGSWFTEKGEKFFDLLSENLSDEDAS